MNFIILPAKVTSTQTRIYNAKRIKFWRSLYTFFCFHVHLHKLEHQLEPHLRRYQKNWNFFHEVEKCNQILLFSLSKSTVIPSISTFVLDARLLLSIFVVILLCSWTKSFKLVQFQWRLIKALTFLVIFIHSAGWGRWSKLESGRCWPVSQDPFCVLFLL